MTDKIFDMSDLTDFLGQRNLDRQQFQQAIRDACEGPCSAISSRGTLWTIIGLWQSIINASMNLDGVQAAYITMGNRRISVKVEQAQRELVHQQIHNLSMIVMLHNIDVSPSVRPTGHVYDKLGPKLYKELERDLISSFIFQRVVKDQSDAFAAVSTGQRLQPTPLILSAVRMEIYSCSSD